MGQQASRCDEFPWQTLDVYNSVSRSGSRFVSGNEYLEAVQKQLGLYYKHFAETRRLLGKGGFIQ